MTLDSTTIENQVPSLTLALAVINGTASIPGTPENRIKAWAWLIRTGIVWELPAGMYMHAAGLIANNYISFSGDINWNTIYDYMLN